MVRRLRAVAAAFAVAGLAGCWLQPGFGPQRGAYNAWESTISVANVAALHVTWNAPLDATPAHDPVMVPGKVLVTDITGLYALDLTHGTRVWHDVLDPGSVREVGDASVNGASVYVPDIVALATRSFDVSTGQEQSHVASGNYGAAIVRGSKVVSDHTGIGTIHSVGIEVDDLSNPALSWGSTEGLEGLGFHDPAPTSAAVGTDRFVFGLGGSVIAYPLTPPTCPPPPMPPLPVPCTPLWTAPIGFTATFPVLSDEGPTVYAGTGSGVSAINATSGTVSWSADLGSAVTQAPAVANDVVYAGTADGRLVALAADGCASSPCAPLWTATVPSAISVQPAVGNGVVYTGSADGSLHAFAAAGCGSTTCPALWTAATGSPITGAPAIALGRLVVGTSDGHVIAYGAK
jgi:outer membrane protein assembly factor BamB